ncbi:ABC1 kinase family protein [Nocardia cyriacigeorgica]|uniref:AarF/ABC1/UbiB kinase family protein n=1 Tax=Nocardia cyriacigeorgica TaxID=135487 RepID=A0A5R8NWZ1_9NOCA|nr:AarF/ABC1/UbiB kinase family protein [Nocardia cyriacigeorgica]TLF80778.1 AarF/ABC1/UbiB kinase family protein [Nocardia cyriacigeorgica]
MGERVPRGRVARGRKLGMLAAGHAARGATTRLSMVGRSERAKELLAQRSTVEAAEQVVEVLGSLKGAAMKLGQMLSVLDLDLVPESHRERFQQKLAVLCDQAPTTPFATMRPVVDEAYGSLGRVFRDFDEVPIAAASIGQVYRATLRDGRDVAVKVQYPGIDAAVRSDLRNLALLAKMWKSMWPTLEGGLLVEEIARNFENELDYQREAHNQHRVARQYRDHPFIAVPDAIVEHCAPRVLVTEYFPSRPFAQMCELPSDQRDRIGELIFRFYVGSLFQRNEFCGDPHPGNVLLAPDGRVGFIDFGLYNRMNPRDVDFERAVMRAAAEQRADDLYSMMVRRGVVDPESAVTAEQCLEYAWSASEWNLLDEPITVTPELASGAVLSAIDPRVSQFDGIRHQYLPPEHVFSRRADFMTFGILGRLGATNNWHRIAREWIYGEPAVTEIGRTLEARRLVPGDVVD